jgi:hypothetical protein
LASPKGLSPADKKARDALKRRIRIASQSDDDRVKRVEQLRENSASYRQRKRAAPNPKQQEGDHAARGALPSWSRYEMLLGIFQLFVSLRVQPTVWDCSPRIKILQIDALFPWRCRHTCCSTGISAASGRQVVVRLHRVR